MIVWRAVTLILAVALFGAAPARYAGRPLLDALHDLERRGLPLIYSSDVVTADMIVKGEPQSAEPRAILDQILREHRLHAVPGPRGSLVIVRDDDKRQHEQKTAAAMLPVTSEHIVVTPSHFTMFSADPEQRQFMSREDVDRLPHFSDDIYRAMSRLPGAATADVSATFNIRGGAEDEVEVLLDGAEIYDPFHVRDLFRAFSTIDSQAVGSVDVLTGGFPAQYGGRMSGVLDIASLTPSERSNEIGISMLSVRAMTSGRFASDRGEWLLSVRRGYLKELLQLIDNTLHISPTYYDLLGKLQYTLTERTIASLHVLGSRDSLRDIQPNGDFAHASYEDQYVWLNVGSTPVRRLYLQNVLSTGRLTRSRSGGFGNAAVNEIGSMLDRRSFEFVTLKSDSTFDANATNGVHFGFTAKQMRASYLFSDVNAVRRSIFNRNPVTIEHSADLRRSGNDLSAYAADRVTLGKDVVAEAGVRWDRQSYTPDGSHVSPRLNVAYNVTPKTAIRAAWGRFYQPQGLHELQVEDGVTDFARAQKSGHRLIALDQAFRGGVAMRLEAYEKEISNPRVRFENMFNRVTLFPELRPDRMRIAPERSKARGAELLVRAEGSGPVSAWASYARASVRDTIDGREVPRNWDQRDAVNFSVNYRRDFWNFNVAGIYHSGWPTTQVIGHLDNGIVDVSFGPLNGDRLRPYRRVDFRASRSVVASRGSLTLFLELMNVLNQRNITRVSGFNFDVHPDGSVDTIRHTDAIIGTIPSFGLNWRF